MKRILFKVMLMTLSLAFMSCNNKKAVPTLTMTRIDSDTISVGRDSSASTSFYFNSSPALDVDNINPVAYNASDDVEDRIQIGVVPYPGLQSSARTTITIYAERDCPTGEYSLRCHANNGKTSSTITYILNVR